MKNFFKVLVKVIRAYSLEEKVLSLLLLMAFLFVAIKSVFLVFAPAGVLAEGGSYTEAEISAIPVLINPLYVDYTQANRDISSLVFSGLLKYDPKLKNFVDDLANLKINQDQKEYLFVLKDNLKWHDGKPLTADDVIFTYSLIQDADFQRNLLLKANFEGVKIVKIDDKTVKFTLDRPNSFFITNLNVGILPKHLLEGVAVQDLLSNQFNVNPVGSGPYKMSHALETSDDGKQKIVLEKFTEYYGNKPKINQIRFNVYPDEESLVKDKGAINIISRASLTLAQLLNDGRFKTTNYALPQYTAIFFNTDSKLKDLKLRIGLVKSIDKDALIAQLKNRLRVDTPLMDLNQQDWLFKPDQKEANGSFFDAGYKFKKDEKGNTLADQKYRLDKDGKMLELNLITRAYEEGSAQDKEVKDTTKFLVDSWEKVGVKINVAALEEKDFQSTVKSKQYDLILTGQNMGYNLDTFSFWHSSQTKQTGSNLSNFRSFAADSEIEKIRQTVDMTNKAVHQKKLAEIIANNAPALFLYRPQYLFLSDEKVGNIYLKDLDFANDRFVDIMDWCMGKDCK